MRLQSQDYIAAQKIQQELSRRLPDDKTIQGFAALLPEEARHQKLCEEGEYDDEYDEEEEEQAYGDEDYGEDDDYVEVKDEEEVPAEMGEDAKERNIERIKKIMEASDEEVSGSSASEGEEETKD